MSRLNGLAAAAGLLCALALSACQSASGGSAPLIGASLAAPDAGFQLEVLGESRYDAARFSLGVEPEQELVVATLRVSGAEALKAAYFDLHYDATVWQPVGAAASGLLAGADEQLLELSVTGRPGVVTHGEVLANWPELDGFSGEGVLATFRFAPADAAAAPMQPRAASGVPTSSQAQTYLNFNARSSVFLWYYVNPGDYDQNGEVGISDLTPLGANFNVDGPFDSKSARAVIDGDGNGAINIADITPIGLNFGNTIDEFAIHGSPDSEDYPAGPSAANGAGSQQFGTRPFGASQGGGSLRKYWEYVLDTPVIGDGYYWLRPVSSGAEGTPSQLVEQYQQWHLQPVYDFGPGLPEDQWLSLANVNGTPSMIIMQNVPELTGKTDIYYLDADDVAGEDWGLPQLIVSDLAANHAAPSLAEINGAPAFSFHEDSIVNHLAYIRAEDAQGSSWTSSSNIDLVDVTNNKLMEFAGKPVVVYTEGNSLYAAISLDEAGVTWLPPETLYAQATDTAGAMGATTLFGGIAAAVDDAITGACIYCFAEIDGSTIAPGSPEQIFPGFTGANERIGLAEAGGAPFMVTKRNSTSLYYGYGGDKSGQDWTDPELCGLGGTKDDMGVGSAYGLPWVCYYDPNTGLVRVGHATDTSGAQWFNISQVAGFAAAPGEGAFHIQMITAGFHPAVAFIASQEDKAYYAVYY